MRGIGIDALSDRDMPRPGPGHGRESHLTDPGIASAGHGNDRILVRSEHILHLLPRRRWQPVLGQTGDLLIALQQLECHPIRRVGLWNKVTNNRQHAFQHILMIGTDLRPVDLLRLLSLSHLYGGIQELVHADAPCRRHRHNRYAYRRRQHLRANGIALLLGDIHHVQADRQRAGKRQ